MLTRFRTMFILQECNRVYCIFAVVVLFSTGLGVFFAVQAEQSYLLLMRMAAGRPVSIVGSAVAALIPYVVSVLVIANFKPWLVYPVNAVRFFLFSAALRAVAGAFGTAGWLMALMLLFPDIFLIPMLVWFSISRLSEGISRRRIILCLIYIGLIVVINYLAVSPFLAQIIHSYETTGRYAVHVGFDWCL